MALDVAGNTGIAEGVPGDVPLLYSEKFTLVDDRDVTRAYGRAVAWAARRLLDNKPVAVFVEGVVPEQYFPGRTNFDATMVRVGLYGALTGVFAAKDIPVFPVNIGKYRRLFTGRGDMKGREGKKVVYDQCLTMGWSPPDMDASDAAAIWWWGCHQSHALFQRKLF